MFIKNIYRVFMRRVNTFVTQISSVFYVLNMIMNGSIYSKFCQHSEYAQFLKVWPLQKLSKQSNQNLANFALAHSKSNHNQESVNLRSQSSMWKLARPKTINLHQIKFHYPQSCIETRGQILTILCYGVKSGL